MSGFATDRRSGSGAVALEFLRELEQWSATNTSRSAPELRAELVGWLRAAQAAQPTMALLHQLAARALEIADAGVARGDPPADLRAHLARSCAAEVADLAAARTAVAGLAGRLLTHRGMWVATLSMSGVVREALTLAQRGGMEPRALVAESRPLMEGRDLSTELAAAGIPVWLMVDAALPLLLSQAQMVWIGADAVTDRGVIGKIGGFAAALAAREHSVPFYALAERRKFLPASTAPLRIAEMAPAEVWERPAEGVRPRNIYFEVVPLELIRGIVVEDDVLGPGEAATVARDRALPRELAGE
jgi:translation initiation factor eIF-2B subunit delta